MNDKDLVSGCIKSVECRLRMMAFLQIENERVSFDCGEVLSDQGFFTSAVLVDPVVGLVVGSNHIWFNAGSLCLPVPTQKTSIPLLEVKSIPDIDDFSTAHSSRPGSWNSQLTQP